MTRKTTQNVKIYANDQGFVSLERTQDDAEMKHHHSRVDTMLRNLGIGAAAIALAPPALNAMGVGKDTYEVLKEKCCPILSSDWNKWGSNASVLSETTGEIGHNKPVFGIAGKLTEWFQQVPGVDRNNPKHIKFTTSGVHNALLAGGIILAGHATGWAVDKMISDKEDGNSRTGQAIKDGTHLLGVFTALPTILPGVGHGLLYLSAVAGVDKLHTKEGLPGSIKAPNNFSRGPAGGVAMLLGKNPGECLKENKMFNAGKGSATVLGAQLCCALPALIPIIVGHGTKHSDHKKSEELNQAPQNTIQNIEKNYDQTIITAPNHTLGT